MSESPMAFRVLVLILGFVSCLTFIGILWGIPMIGWALGEQWTID